MRDVALGPEGVLAGLLPYIGPNGSACAMKLAVNLLLMVEVITFGEAVALAEKAAVDRAGAVEAILNSVAASPVLAYRGPFILEGRMPDRPWRTSTPNRRTCSQYWAWRAGWEVRFPWRPPTT